MATNGDVEPSGVGEVEREASGCSAPKISRDAASRAWKELRATKRVRGGAAVWGEDAAEEADAEASGLPLAPKPPRGCRS